MALVVNTNVASLMAQKNLGTSQAKLDTAMERLSSGSRINSASDDAAGLAIASRMESQVRGLNQAVRNANDGVSLAQTAEGAMEEITAMLQRMRELSVQGSNGVLNANDRVAIDAEVDALKAEIDRVVTTTTFNGKNLLDGSFGSTLQVGGQAGETLAINIANMGTSSLGTTSGATSAEAVRSASFAGTAATTTTAKLTFEGNDTYSFALTLGGLNNAGTANAAHTFNISGSVSGGSAKDIVDEINAALRVEPEVTKLGSANAIAGSGVAADAASAIRATYNGNTITIENLAGGTIDVAQGAVDSANPTNAATGSLSNSGSNVVYTSIVGGTGTNDSKIIGGSGNTATALVNNGANASGGSAGTNPVASSMVLNFADSTGATPSSTIAAGDRIVMTLTSGSDVLTLDTGLVQATTDVAGVVAHLQAALTTSGNTDYTVAAFTGDDAASSAGVNVQNTHNFVITRADGAEFTVALDSDTSITTHTLFESAVDLNTTTGSPAVDAKIHGEGAISLNVGAFSTIEASDNVVLKLTDANGVETTLDTGAFQAVATQASLVSSLTTALSNASNTAYTVAAHGSVATAFTITKTDGGQFTVEYVKADSTDASTTLALTELAADRSISDGGSDTQEAINGTLGVAATAATLDESVMFLDFVGSDTYTLKFTDELSGNGTSGVTLNYNGTAASLADAAIKLEAEARSMTAAGRSYDFSVTVDNGRLKIEEAGGLAFRVTGSGSVNSPISAGSGKIMASVASGQNVSGAPSAVLLDDTVYASSAGTSNAGTVSKTDLTLTLSGDDTVSFTITDGTATAQVNPVAVDQTSGDGGDLASAINVALAQAGLDDVMLATKTAAGAAKITHDLGYEVTINDYTSIGSQNMKAEATTGASGVTGIAKFLDDAAGSSSTTISSVDVTTASLASDAIDVIDRAIADVNAERSTLGAIQNRLGHTINNLSNISVNTAAAQSRIEDADYSVEAANLAKAQIMQQAGTAMLAQANAMQQTVLSLLQ